jgi:O-antigen/teichoic acid export membrane protein
MGIIQRQGSKNAIVNYLGVAIAAISTLFIYPLDKELYGFAQFLFSTAYFLVPFASIGTLALVVKFFPRFKENNSAHHGFLLTLVLLCIVGFGAFLALSWVFKDILLGGLSKLGMNAQLISNNSLVIFTLCFVLIFSILLTQFISNFRRIVVPAMIRELGFKIFLPVIFIVCYIGWISQQQLAWGLVLFFSFVVFSLLFYINHLGQLSFKSDWRFLTKKLRKGMGSFMLFGSLNSFGSNLSLRIDSIMIPIMIGLSSNGIYNILLFVANAIEIPTRALNQITGPIISTAWAENDTGEIKTVYRKSSINLLIVGGFIFLILWFSIDALFSLSPKGEEISSFKLVFLFLAIGKLFDMAGGVNNHIISYSSKYKYNLLFLLVLGITNVLLNYWLIDDYGIVGAAIATASSLVLFNLLKFVFIWRTWGLQPFDKKVLILILLLVLCFVSLTYISLELHPILQILFNISIISVIYIPLIYFLKLSEDFNSVLIKSWNILKSWKA